MDAAIEARLRKDIPRGTLCTGDVRALLAEVDRLRAVIDDLADNPDAPEIASLHASAHRRTA